MSIENSAASNTDLTKTNDRAVNITLVDGGEPFMKRLHTVLKTHSVTVQTIDEAQEVGFALAKTDLLIMDLTTAEQPKSSNFTRVPAILVLTTQPDATLPPWLQLDHVSLRLQPEQPTTLLDELPRYLTTSRPKLSIVPHDTKDTSLLFGITQFLSGHLDFNDLLERILELAPYLDAQFCSLLVIENDNTLHYRSTQPGREELTRAAGRRLARRLLVDGLEGWVIEHQQAAVVADTQQEPRYLQASYLPNVSNAVVMLPIHLERVDARGVFVIGHSQPGRFSVESLPLLEAVTTQIRMAIENALLFRNQAQRSVQLALINKVGHAATSILNLDVMLRTVVQAIRRSFTFYSVVVYLYNQHSQTVQLYARSPAEQPSAKDSPGHRLSLKEGLIGWAASTRKTVLANDVTREPRYIINPAHRDVRAELCVPIVMGPKLIGVLDLQSTQLEAFDRYHISALETLADQLAIAIENARLYEEINRRVQELQSLNDIGQAITSTLDLRKTLTLVTDQTIRLMNVAAASVALHDEQQGDVWFAAASGEGAEAVIGQRMARGQGIAGWVAASGEPVIVPDVKSDTRFFADMDEHSGFTTRSILCVPLQTKGHSIGAIEVMNKHSSTFDQDDLKLLQALAAPAATAIENAQLYEEKTKTIERLAETQSQLVQSAKLAAVGELAAGVAHEINNPLTAIIGLTSLLLEESEEEEAIEDLTMVHGEARRARDIVRNLLNFARADKPQRRPTDVNQVINEAIFLVYNKQVSQKISLQKNLAELPDIYLDANQIKQVLVNLLNNAIQAMQDNGKRPAELIITTALKPTPASTAKHLTLILTISDTGSGIEPEDMPKIFDPFFTTKEVGQGTGLGLSVSYGIIEQHNGLIYAESIVQQGTTFTVELPAITQPLPAENKNAGAVNQVSVRQTSAL